MKRAAMLCVSLSLAACASRAPDGCSAPGWTPIASPPSEVTALYQSSPDLKGHRRGYHDHWAESSDGSVRLCRHPVQWRGGCGGEIAIFPHRSTGWTTPDLVEVVICSSGNVASATR